MIYYLVEKVKPKDIVLLTIKNCSVGKHMKFESIHYFQVLASELNFTQAAKKLFITQQALSTNIANLEEELDCQLLIRRNPLELTFAGRVFLKYCEIFSNYYQSMLRELSDVSEGQRGELRVGAGFSHGMILLPKAIQTFQADHPNISILIDDSTSEPDLIEKAVTGKIDLVIKSFHTHDSRLEYVRFFEERIVMLVPRQFLKSCTCTEGELFSKVSSGDLTPFCDYPFLLNENGGMSYRAAMQLFDASKIKPEIKVSSNNIYTTLKLCCQSNGICFAPLNIVQGLLSAQELACIRIFSLPDEFRYEIQIAYQKMAYSWSVIQSFIRDLRSAYYANFGD